MNDKPKLTLDLQHFVNSHLGKGNFTDIHGTIYYDQKWTNRPIDATIAEVIVCITKNEHTCYIQYADEYSPHLTTPLLWDYQAWLIQVDSWVRAKERSRLERIERHILEANIRICTRKWMELYCADEEQAEQTVASLLRRGKKKQLMVALDIDKLIEKESELI